MKISKLILLIAIVCLGAFLRFYKLDQIPAGFYVDEAAIAVNANSILKTGLDEYGKAWPVFLRSYNAYSSPLYTYLTTFSIQVFGFTVFAARFMSALAGTVSIIFVYLILKKLKISPLLGTLIFTLSPWGIFFSRGAFEANLAFLLFTIAVYLLLTDKKYFFILAAAVLGVSTYAYQAMRLVSILILPAFVLIKYKKKFINREVVVAALVFTIIQLPQFWVIGSAAFANRASGLFYNQAIMTQATKIPLPDFITLPLAFMREFLANFVSYLSPRNLFLTPDSDPQRSLPELSVFYSWLIVPFVFGLTKLNRQTAILVAVAVLPAALTRDPFSSLRSLSLLLPLIIIVASGLKNKTAFIYTLLTIPLSLLFLWRSYFVLFPQERARTWSYGYQRLAQIIKDNPGTHYLIDESRNNPSYVLLAFFMHVPPEEIQAASPNLINNYYSAGEFDNRYQIANFETGKVVWEEDIYENQVLVGDSLAISDTQAREHFLTKKFEIRDPTGEIVFVGYQTDPQAKCQTSPTPSEKCSY
ncbi:hypothetical protein A2630_01850 [Candidatus Woesebacteria bacterium RIFCSPHIGHO2_01_FULL_44_10]|uniref:Glycosyltransferase RgtA/B/C/D-like domain-containing protein n=1 Tax=Candidatus Woesebacteria bacterium RIFCSPLOWO2_01_FULL_44_14 TaxID=1802525 RepID=A0A1F8C1F8_9BACT|nr:MAG: hypothetical protein A2630_01850 [Candidatus Woesebacteria bacterium RIFCSPHIGHO2_01_FULL_44_10]OGM54002.1 MAG: hypothetical protein A3F62_00335 [Candidatus Woesebacteria bacterium RIFCSPHIGHO2_12_FULL_44_11]OGM69970.1 MAG: hypothetical protein A2975_05175 [Candidatus Woesebacteria bacterium RIFCSPLOWO2_01_FULL_44_14]